MNFKTKTIKMMVLVGGLMIIAPSCKKGCTDPNATNYDENVKKDNGSCLFPTEEWYTEVTVDNETYYQISGTITENQTMNSNHNWLLSGGVYVAEGVTLTIAPGTTIYAADDGTVPFLSVQQGGKLNACGTASSPIVFTPIKANPSPGDWGGIILNGYAPINTGTTAQGEGNTGTYGGTDSNDDSGTLCYIRVEFAGKILGTDNELNGFSFNGIGSGTTLHHLQAYRGSDDGFEFFGGTASLSHALSSGNHDDSFDWTHGWSGNGQFWVAEQNNDGGDRGIEGDNNGSNNAASPYSNPTISNVTLIGIDDGDAMNQGVKFREGMKGNFYNFVITGFPKRGIQVEHDITLSNLESGTLTFNNSIVDNVNPYVYTSSAGNDTSSFITNKFDDAGFNNTSASDGSLVWFLSGYVGISASGAYDPTILGIWFTNANFIGAVDPSNNWTSGWTRAL